MTKINLPDNSYILYALAGANAIGFAWASIAIEGGNTGFLMTLIFALRGILMGLAAGFGMASISNKIPRAAKAAKAWGYLGLAIIGLSAPVMMSPVVYARLSVGALSSLPWEVRLAMSVAVGILSDGLILGVAATSGKLQAEESTQQVAPQDAQVPRKRSRKVAKVAISKAIFAGYLREYPAATDEQVAQHFGVSRQAVNARRKTVTPTELGLTK